MEKQDNLNTVPSQPLDDIMQDNPRLPAEQEERAKEIADLQGQHHQIGINGLKTRCRNPEHEGVQGRRSHAHANAHGQRRSI